MTIFKKLTAFSKKVTDLTDVPSENLSPAQIKSYFDTPDEELLTTLNTLVDDLNANGWVDTNKLGTKAVTRDKVAAGAIGTNEIDPAIMSEPTTVVGVQAKLADHDAQLADIAINIENFPRIENETDDSPRILRAIISLNGNKGKLIFRATKTYIVNNFIDLPNNVEIIGNYATITNTVAGLPFLFKAEGKSNVSIEKLYFIPDGLNKPNNGIRIKDCTNVKIDDCIASGFQQDGFNITGTSDLEMRNCTGNDSITANGIKIQANNVHLFQCYANNNAMNGFHVWSTKSFVSTNLKIINCQANNNKNFGLNTFGELDTVSGADFGRKWGPTLLYVKNLTAMSNGTDGSYSGIQFDGVNVGWIEDCYTYQNNEHGIVLMDSRYIYTKGNYTRKNNMSGIRLQGDYSQKTNYDGSWRGVFYSKIDGNISSANGENSFNISVTDYVKSGISVDYNCQYNRIKNNNVQDNYGYGVSIFHSAGYSDSINNILEQNDYINNTLGKFFIDSFNVKNNTVIPYREQKKGIIDNNGVLSLGVGDFFYVDASSTNITSISADDTYKGRIVTIRFTGINRIIRSGTLRVNGDVSTLSNMVLTLMTDGSTWWEISRSHINADVTGNLPTTGITKGYICFDASINKLKVWNGSAYEVIQSS